MTALGELLEAMHGAGGSLGPVEGTLREWRNERLVAWLAPDWPDENEENRRRPSEDEFEQLTTFTLAPPDRLRLETRDPDASASSIVVCDGSRSATWLAGWGTSVDDLDRAHLDWMLGPVGQLLDPAWLLGLLEFDSVRPHVHGERHAFRARGRPRSPLPWPFGPADEHELVVDRERGTVHRLTGLLRHSEAFVHELVGVEYGVTVDDDTFALPATGEVSGLGLREAARLVDFPLWALPRPVLDVTYRPEPLPSVTLAYHDAYVVLTSASVDQGFVTRGEPEVVERGRRTYWLEPGGIFFAEGDTFIRLTRTHVGGDDLVATAESMVPVA